MAETLNGHRVTGAHRIRALPNRDLPAEFFEALASLYREQATEMDEAESEIWRENKKSFWLPLIGAAEQGQLRPVLENLYESKILWGLDNCPALGLTDQQFLDWWDAEAIATATAAGVLPEYNPEQPSGQTLEPEQIIGLIEEVAGFQLGFTQAGGNMRGLEIGNRIVPIKQLESLRTLFAIRRYRAPNRVLEIGGGCGFLAANFVASGMIDYSILDLPPVALLQGYLLACLLGPEHVAISPGTAPIKICGLRWPKGKFDCFVNQNSMPEIPDAATKAYLAAMSESPGAFLFSINHESNLAGQRRVYDWIGGRWPLRVRCPAFGRQGYLQEIYEAPWLSGPDYAKRLSV